MGMIRTAAGLVADWIYGSRKFAHGRGWHRAVVYPGGAKAPVLMLPGVYETADFLAPLAKRLSDEGHPIHVLDALRRNVMPVTDAAALAARYLEQHDLRDVVLVAHSKGGLIGKYLMLFEDADARVDRMVAIASPFNGSSMSRYFPNRALRAFLPTDATLMRIGAEARVNSRVTSIFGSFDAHIPEGSKLAGADNREFPIVGHFRILVDPAVLDLVTEVAARPSTTHEPVVVPKPAADQVPTTEEPTPTNPAPPA